MVGVGSGQLGSVWLRYAARVLPAVAVGRLLSVDLVTALFHAATVLGIGRDRAHRLAACDRVVRAFVRFLLASGRVGGGGGSVVRAWALGRGVAAAQQDLLAMSRLLACCRCDPVAGAGRRR